MYLSAKRDGAGELERRGAGFFDALTRATAGLGIPSKPHSRPSQVSLRRRPKSDSDNNLYKEQMHLKLSRYRALTIV